jgi:hypothetical protein
MLQRAARTTFGKYPFSLFQMPPQLSIYPPYEPPLYAPEVRNLLFFDYLFFFFQIRLQLGLLKGLENITSLLCTLWA